MVIASAMPFIAEEFELSPLSMGAVLSAFFVGYSLMQIPGGVLSDRFGVNRLITGAVCCWSIFTALTATAYSLAALLVVRFLFGISEGVFPPSAAKALSVWFPNHEVGRANGVVLAATQTGSFLAPLLVAAMVIHWGWRSVFVIMLLPGLLLTVTLYRYVKDSPALSRHVSAAELAEYGPVAESPHSARGGLSAALRTPAMAWCAAALFCAAVANWGVVNWLPMYLLQVRGFSVAKMGILSSLPFVTGAVGYFTSGYISDRWFSRRRQVPILAGLILTAGLTCLAAIASSGEWAVALLVAASLFLHISLGGIYTLPLVLMEKSAVGSAFGLVNTAGQVAALLSPLLVGLILDRTDRDFDLLFGLFVLLFLAAAFMASRIRQSR